jgi:hypothetical protein
MNTKQRHGKSQGERWGDMPFNFAFEAIRLSGRRANQACDTRYALPGIAGLGEGEIEIFDGFVDFGGVFVADGDGIDAGAFEGEAHGSLAVFAVE